MGGTESVTVLFTDLVGSTELASALSPEAGDELRRAHFSLLRQAIAASGGTEVKNLGDGLMVVFPAASAALSCAVAMQQAVDRYVPSQRPRNMPHSCRSVPPSRRSGMGGRAAWRRDSRTGKRAARADRLC